MKKLIAALFSSLFLLLSTAPSFAAGQATLNLVPPTATAKVDNLFTVEIHVNTAGVAVNTIKAYLTFDPTVLEVTSITTTGSIASIFTENDPDNVNGTIHITGAATGSGYTGSNGLFATLNLKAKGAGTSTLTFTSDSKVNSNVDDSDILNFTGLVNGSYTVSGTGTGGGDTTTTTASGSALPDSGSSTQTLTLVIMATLLIGSGLVIAKPSRFSLKKLGWK